MADNPTVTIWIIDREGTTSRRCEAALRQAGWAVKLAASAAEVKPPVDAVVLAGDLSAVGKLREQPACRTTPIVLVISLDRSRWGPTFQDEAAFDADALLDTPVDSAALVARLRGILDARAAASPAAPLPAFRDVIQRAVANEEAAERFYRQAASASGVPATRAVLEDLALEEQGHRRLLLEFLEGKRAFLSAPEAIGSVVETFGTPDLTPDLLPADAFLLAARKEKLAAEFYQNWAHLCPPGPERDLLLGLADMERRHKKRVEDLFVTASFPEDFFE
jgi:rubrerythrin